MFTLPQVREKLGAWDESKHPRGQPKNRGEFRSGGGGSSSSSGSSGGGHHISQSGMSPRMGILVPPTPKTPSAKPKPTPPPLPGHQQAGLQQLFGGSAPSRPPEHDANYKPKDPFRAPGTGPRPENLGSPGSVDEARDQLIWLLGRSSILREQGRAAGRATPKMTRELTLNINLASRLQNGFFKLPEKPPQPMTGPKAQEAAAPKAEPKKEPDIRSNPLLEEAFNAPSEKRPEAAGGDMRHNPLLDEAMGMGGGSRQPPANQGELLANVRKEASERDLNDPMRELQGVNLKQRSPQLSREVASQFDAHGTASLDSLTKLLNGGIDKNRQFFSSPLSEAGNQQGYGVTVRDNSSFVALSHPGKTLKEGGIGHVLVDPLHEQSIPHLQQAFPHVQFHAASKAHESLSKLTATSKPAAASGGFKLPASPASKPMSQPPPLPKRASSGASQPQMGKREINTHVNHISQAIVGDFGRGSFHSGTRDRDIGGEVERRLSKHPDHISQAFQQRHGIDLSRDSHAEIGRKFRESYRGGGFSKDPAHRTPRKRRAAKSFQLPSLAAKS